MAHTSEWAPAPNALPYSLPSRANRRRTIAKAQTGGTAEPQDEQYIQPPPLSGTDSGCDSGSDSQTEGTACLLRAAHASSPRRGEMFKATCLTQRARSLGAGTFSLALLRSAGTDHPTRAINIWLLRSHANESLARLSKRQCWPTGSIGVAASA